jgi:hypothetical protein
MRAAVVKVTALSALIPIPTFTPPPSNHPLPLGEDVEEETPLEFGGTNNGHAGGEVGALVAGGEAAAQGETGWTSAGASFSSGNQSAHVPSAASNILWGAAAAAVLGMTLADWQRKREEEAAARLAAERANEVPDDVLAKRRAKVMAKNQAQRNQERVWEQARQAQNAKPEIDEDTFMQKTYKKILSTANVIPGVSAWKEKQEEQAKQNAVSAARWAGVASVAQGKQEEELIARQEETWASKAWNWTFNNQVELSLGTGVAAGLAAVVIVATAAVTAPAWVVVGGAVLATAAIVTAGTVAINSHFGLGLGNNLAANLIVGTAATLITAGIGLVVTSLAPVIGTAVTTTCAHYATVCSQIGTIIDVGEEALLSAQIAYYTWTGNQDGAAQAAIELQLEQMDGGVPGNSLAVELSEQIAKLGPNASELIIKHGSDIVPLLLKYGDDAVNVIGTYGDEGISLLTLYGDDAVGLITKHGTPAIDLMMQHGDNAINALQGRVVAVDNVEEFVTVLQTVFPNSRVWFSSSSGQVYFSNSSEQALKASQQLVSINASSDNIAELISEIAKGSTHGSGNRVVLGAYDPNSGYIGDAMENGGIFFDTGNEVWDNLTKSGLDDIFAVNEQFLKNQLEVGVERIDFVGEDIWNVVNNPDPNISNSFRAQEINWLLQNAGKFGYELQGNSWVLVQR